MSKRPLTYTFTGDLSSHDRCKRAWAYEKHIKFTPPEQVQAVFGNLYHSSLEWLAKSYRQHTLHGTPLPNSEDFRKVLLKFLRMLRAQGISSKVTTDDQIADIVLGKIYPTHTAGKRTTAMDPEFEKIISNAERTEVDLRAPVDLKRPFHLGTQPRSETIKCCTFVVLWMWFAASMTNYNMITRGNGILQERMDKPSQKRRLPRKENSNYGIIRPRVLTQPKRCIMLIKC